MELEQDSGHYKDAMIVIHKDNVLKTTELIKELENNDELEKYT